MPRSRRACDRASEGTGARQSGGALRRAVRRVCPAGADRRSMRAGWWWSKPAFSTWSLLVRLVDAGDAFRCTKMWPTEGTAERWSPRRPRESGDQRTATLGGRAQLAREIAIDEVSRQLDARAPHVAHRDFARQPHAFRGPVDCPVHLGGERAPWVLTRHEDDPFDWPRRLRSVDVLAYVREPHGQLADGAACDGAAPDHVAPVGPDAGELGEVGAREIDAAVVDRGRRMVAGGDHVVTSRGIPVNECAFGDRGVHASRREGRDQADQGESGHDERVARVEARSAGHGVPPSALRCGGRLALPRVASAREASDIYNANIDRYVSTVYIRRKHSRRRDLHGQSPSVLSPARAPGRAVPSRRS